MSLSPRLNLKKKSFLVDLLLPLSFRQLLLSMQSLMSLLQSPKNPGFPFPPRHSLYLQEFMSFKCSNHSHTPLPPKALCLFCLRTTFPFSPLSLYKLAVLQTHLQIEGFNSHPLLTEILLLLHPSSTPATTRQVPQLSLTATRTQLP